jgi:aryl-alcohol dehydrogenase-like predicted oxidoreductase
MEKRQLGSSGVAISRLGLGTLTWGRDTDEHDAADQLREFLNSGGNYLETSPNYGGGDSEKVIGGFLNTLVPRSELFVAVRAGVGKIDDVGQNSRSALIRSLDQSLKNLDSDYLDLWLLSNWDESTPIEESLSALDYAVQSGKVRYLGVSNFHGWQLARAYSLQNPLFNHASIVVAENEYSLLNRKIENEVLPAVNNLGMGLIAWSPLGRGVLTGKYQNGIPSDSRAASSHFASFLAPYLTNRCKAIVDAIEVAASGLGYSPIEIALAWVRDSLGVTSALLGARNTAQLRMALTVEEIVLPDEVRVALDEVSATSLA